MAAVTSGHENPAGHGAHPLVFDTKYVPCAQSPEDWQSAALVVRENIQSGQSAHMALAVISHMTLRNWPATQVVHALGAVSPAVSQ